MRKANFRIVPTTVAGDNMFKVEKRMWFMWEFVDLCDTRNEAESIINHLTSTITYVKG